jgi:hypothetical protein
LAHVDEQILRLLACQILVDQFSSGATGKHLSGECLCSQPLIANCQTFCREFSDLFSLPVGKSCGPLVPFVTGVGMLMHVS